MRHAPLAATAAGAALAVGAIAGLAATVCTGFDPDLAGFVLATWTGFGAGLTCAELTGADLGGGAALALVRASATAFLRSASGSNWSSWARVSFAGSRPCAAERLT